MHEEDLRAALASDLDGTFERLVLAYQGRLYAFALRLTGRREDAEEIAQDTFVRAYRALAAYPAERIACLALRAWLFQITVNVARNRRRKPGINTVSLDGDGSEAVFAEPEDDERTRPEALAERGETARTLAAELAALPDRYRAAVVLRHVEGLGYAELAGVLGQPVGTVKANVHRGVLLLRQALAPRMETSETLAEVR
jgi:RNA polymerase sigma-70 factor (ECF subfamily)